jgi:NAD(P)-dependent dehydrogenase (short-subunit alcohol dehydrogenase family)
VEVEEVAQQPSRNRALVTGGASGLGAALCRALVARGDEVLSADVNPPSGDSGPIDGVEYLSLDVRSDEDWAAAHERVLAKWGSLDLLFNNAGVAGGGRLDVAGLDEWQWITEINLFGVVRGTRTFVPLLKAQGSGTIVNTASLAGLVHPAGMASYNAVKAAVVAFSETAGHELAEYGIKVAVVCPSYFRTPLIENMQGTDVAVGSVIGALVASSPVSADDVAAAVLAGLDNGDELILPDEAAQAAYGLKLADRDGYNAIMRKQAARLNAME